MRIKNFTLLTLALLLMSVVASAQKPANGQLFKITPEEKAFAAKMLDAQKGGQYQSFKTAVPQKFTAEQKIPSRIKGLAKTKNQVLKSPRRADETSSVVTYTFDDSSLEGWTTIDADGDGHTWVLGSAVGGEYLEDGVSLAGSGHNSSADMVVSGSYSNVFGALTPDNYLVSPKVSLGGTIVFYACGQDASYVAEHFGVAVSVKGNTDDADFTTLQNWTMTSAPVLAPPSFANGNSETFRAPRRAQGNWYRFTYDLSAYSGQEGYVAIRHFGCTDMFLLDVDDITIYPEGVEVEEEVIPVTYYLNEGAFMAYASSGWVNYTDDYYSVKLGISSKGNVTLSGLAYFFEANAVTGTLEGNKIIIPNGQLVGTDEYGDEFIVGVDENFNVVENIEFEYDETAKTLKALTPYIFESSSSDLEGGIYTYWDHAVFSTTEPEILYYTAPDGLVTEEWGFFAKDYSTDEDVLIPVQVGFDGDDVYVLGLLGATSCVKGTRNGNTVTFQTGQYLGWDIDWSTFDVYYLFFVGYGAYGIQDVTMTLNTEENLMTTNDYIAINTKQHRLYYTHLYANAFLKKDYIHKITFAAANDLSIQNGKATVTVNGKPAAVDAEGKLEVPETYTVTIKAAKGYRFVSASSTDATVTLADDLFSATFEMPTKDATINYQLREMDGEIVFATEGEYTIQGGQASVLVGDADVTKNVDDKGKLIDIAPGSTITINAEQGYKLTSVTASYTPKSAGGTGLTVFDGTATNAFVPVYGLYTDAFLKSETVMPASELTALNGETISAMSFYLTTPAAGAWTSTFKVFLKEISETTLAAYSGVEGATVVYEGKLDATGETMDIQFNTPYTYNGGNLLIGVYCIEEGNYTSAYFAGTEVTGASVQGYSYTSLDDVATNVRNFIPKTTFTCAGTGGAVGVDVALAKKGNTASFIMPGPGGQVNVAYEIVRLGSPVMVPAGAYITYYTDKDVLIYDADCELMTVTGINANEAVVTPLKVVAANTPMLVHNSGADKEVWMVPAEETVEEPAADEVTVAPQFKGTLTEKTFTEADMAAKDYFACNGASFAWVRGAGTIGANKCWLEFEKDAMLSTPSLAIVYGGGETTGINTANGKMETEGQYYDLNGRKLNAAPTQKGVYIINGKKAVIK